MKTWLLRLFQRKTWTRILDRTCYLFVLTDFDPNRKQYVINSTAKYVAKLGLNLSAPVVAAIVNIAEKRCKRRIENKKKREAANGN